MISKTTLLNTIDDSISEVFSTSLCMEIKKDEDSLNCSTEDLIISSMGISGSLNGNISIWINELKACALISRMLDMTIEEGSSDVLDGCGEILNMIAGSLKNKLEGTELTFELSIPTTVKGDHLSTTLSPKTALLKENYMVNDLPFQFNFIYQIEPEKAPTPPEKKTVASAFDLLNQALQKAEQGTK